MDTPAAHRSKATFHRTIRVGFIDGPKAPMRRMQLAGSDVKIVAGAEKEDARNKSVIVVQWVSSNTPVGV